LAKTAVFVIHRARFHTHHRSEKIFGLQAGGHARSDPDPVGEILAVCSKFDERIRAIFEDLAPVDSPRSYAASRSKQLMCAREQLAGEE
jgi:hypothetical protein